MNRLLARIAEVIIRSALASVLWAVGAASLQAAWEEEFTAGNFVFRSEFPLSDVQELLNDLSDLQTELEQTLGVKCVDREIQIHLFCSKANYQRYLSVRVPDGAKRQAFFMPGTDAGRIYAYRHRGMETDVRHETTHALLRNALPYVPLWLDEGLAEYYEVPSGKRHQGDGHLKELRWAQRFGWRPELERLEAKRKFLELGAKDYRDAWAVVQFLLQGPPEGRLVLQAYLREIESGDVPTPLSELLKDALPDYEAEINRQLKRP